MPKANTGALIAGVAGLTATAIGLGIAVSVAESESAAGEASTPAVIPNAPGMPKVGYGWSDPDGPRRIWNIAKRVEDQTGWENLAKYLIAVSWTESRGNPDAQNGSSPNAARGWFGMRPATALAHQLAPYRDRPNLVKDERLSVALAAWLAYRLRNYAAPMQVLDWLAIRRGWALPRLVADWEETAEVKGYYPGERSRDVRIRFSQALVKSGLPQSFMRIHPYKGLKWPGIWRVMDAAGVDYDRLGIVRGGAQS